jgi:hypothetical protein
MYKRDRIADLVYTHTDMEAKTATGKRAIVP